MVSIFALINRPQCIASLFVQIISHMFFGFSREPVSDVIIWKLEAQSLESHKVFFDNRSYRNLFSALIDDRPISIY